MFSEKFHEGEATQGHSPDWAPLELVIGGELPEWFMWMFEVQLTNGLVLNAYKHRMSREYMHLSRNGSCFDFRSPNRYFEVDLAMAIERAFRFMGPYELPPEQRQALDKAIEKAEWL